MIVVGAVVIIDVVGVIVVGAVVIVVVVGVIVVVNHVGSLISRVFFSFDVIPSACRNVGGECKRKRTPFFSQMNLCRHLEY